jgi:prevent-host-death family protein
MEVGIRDLKNNLSRYLAQLVDGDEIVVTDRGRAIAKIIPTGRERTIDRLIDEGIVTPASSLKRPAPRKRVRATKPVSPLVGEQRR